jgi:hypothetical protein
MLILASRNQSKRTNFSSSLHTPGHKKRRRCPTGRSRAQPGRNTDCFSADSLDGVPEELAVKKSEGSLCHWKMLNIRYLKAFGSRLTPLEF